MENHTVFITGITGQDGVFLASQLLDDNKDFQIYGTSRKSNNTEFFEKVNLISQSKKTDQINLLNVNIEEENEVNNIIKDINPNYIINLSGPSSVNNSLKDENSTMKSINRIFDNLIKASIELKKLPTFFQATSSEMFSIKNENYLNEESLFEPRSPYAQAKFECYQKVKTLRESHDWDIKSGIMFNHESEFRPEGYLFSKIINQAIGVKNNKVEKIEVGSLSYVRDWSFAGDVAKAIKMIIFSEISDDFVIGSGEGNSIEKLIQIIFQELDLDYKEYIKINEGLLREGDPEVIISDPSKIKDKLGWSANLDFEKLVKRCLDFKLTTP